ncbi:MAG: acetolactate decarboxylase [Dehalococcoidales bacterium]|nr:acetolactate decarboxylase [Dehalococcoidales bacterium]
MRKRFKSLKSNVCLIMIMAAMFALALAGCAATPDTQTAPGNGAKDTLYQVSTLGALMQGVYDGEMEVGKLVQEGDLGIGTFEALDGEMVVLDGRVYQVRGDGKVVEVDDAVKTPFAVVTWFESDQQIQSLTGIESYDQLKAELDKLRSSPNLFYAYKVEGTFEYVKTRSVPPQSKPYPPLVEVTDLQPTFELHNVKGTLVGFWFPSYAEGVNMPGFHFHFLTEDYTAGGHLLECILVEGSASVDNTTEFYMRLPENEHFTHMSLEGVAKGDIERAEQ